MITPEQAESARIKILALSRWLDKSPGYQGISPETANWRRITKIAVEGCEAIDALGGVVGENPRKGVTNGWDKVEYEILDGALAALGALAHLYDNTGIDPLARLVAHIDTVHDRAGRPA